MRESTTSPSSTNTTTPPGSRQQHRLPLSCRECQRKKVKCDRSYPCGQCSRAGHGCTPSTRKPRAKVGSRAVDIELRNRIAKLEKLVETFQGDENIDASTGPASPDALEPARKPSDSSNPPASQPSNDNFAFTGLCLPSADVDEGAPSSGSQKYTSGSFLSTLSTEVQALREAFEEHDLEDDYDALSSEPTPPQGPSLNGTSNPASGTYELLLCPPGALFAMPGVIREPEPNEFIELCSMYLGYMEPMLKIFHVPTLEAFLFRGEPYLGHDSEAPCNRALRAAICFAGMTAMREDEALSRFSRPRDKLIAEYRRMVDVAIYQTDPMNTTDIAALQALVLYSSAIRMVDPTRRAWTLLGLITRIARALNVHVETPNEPVFKREICRRLWYHIVYLDCYATMDRGSEPAIDPSTFDRPLPTNCNDSDFTETSRWVAAREGEITDMSFTLVCLQGSTMILQMSSLVLGHRSLAQPAWQHRLALANSFSQTIDTQILRFCDPSIPSQRLLIAVGKAASHSMVLRAVRPLNAQNSSVEDSPPRVSTLWVLQLAVVCLQHGREMLEDEETNHAWRRAPWVPWHAIAVALAGLCSIRDAPLADEAWALVEAAMPRHAGEVADSRTGMLWKPIEKLRRKAAAFRDQGRSDAAAAAAAAVTATGFAGYAQQQQQHRMALPVQHPDQMAGLAAEDMAGMAGLSLQQDGQFDGGVWSGSNMIGRNPGMKIEMPGVGVGGMTGAPVMPIPTPIATDLAASSFLDFPPEMLASVPDEGSWLDWEAIMKDMEDVNNLEKMQMT